MSRPIASSMSERRRRRAFRTRPARRSAQLRSGSGCRRASVRAVRGPVDRGEGGGHAATRACGGARRRARRRGRRPGARPAQRLAQDQGVEERVRSSERRPRARPPARGRRLPAASRARGCRMRSSRRWPAGSPASQHRCRGLPRSSRTAAETWLGRRPHRVGLGAASARRRRRSARSPGEHSTRAYVSAQYSLEARRTGSSPRRRLRAG